MDHCLWGEIFVGFSLTYPVTATAQNDTFGGNDIADKSLKIREEGFIYVFMNAGYSPPNGCVLVFKKALQSKKLWLSLEKTIDKLYFRRHPLTTEPMFGWETRANSVKTNIYFN